MHSTNCFNTFIAVADDCSATQGTPPKPGKGKPTVAQLQYAMLVDQPHRHTSDEVLFQVHAARHEITPADMAGARTVFFAKGQPCFRASPLTKTHGYGVHFDAQGRMALVAMESAAYRQHLSDGSLKQVKAMRSRKAV